MTDYTLVAEVDGVEGLGVLTVTDQGPHDLIGETVVQWQRNDPADPTYVITHGPDDFIDGPGHIRLEGLTAPFTARGVVLRGLGTPETIGEYSLHLHHNGDGTRGSLIEHVVVDSAVNFGIVPHASHGVTHRNIITFGGKGSTTVGGALKLGMFGWDLRTDAGDPGADFSNDTLYEDCLAIDTDESAGAPFLLAGGHDNVMRRCVALRPQSGTGGFRWPAELNGTTGSLWTFEDCATFGPADAGMFVWQNDPESHDIVRYKAYRIRNSQGTGIGSDHGAYNNRYWYIDCEYHDNDIGINWHSRSDRTKGRVGSIIGCVFENNTVDIRFPFNTTTDPTKVRDVDIIGGNPRIIEFADARPPGSTTPDVASRYNFIDTGWNPFAGEGVLIMDGVVPESEVIITEGGVEVDRFTFADLVAESPSAMTSDPDSTRRTLLDTRTASLDNI